MVLTRLFIHNYLLASYSYSILKAIVIATILHSCTAIATGDDILTFLDRVVFLATYITMNDLIVLSCTYIHTSNHMFIKLVYYM